MMTKQYRRLLSDTAIFATGNVVYKLVLFITLPILTSYLTTEEYGTSEILISINEILVPLLSLSIADSVFRFSINKNNDKSYVFSFAFNIWWISSVIFILSSIALSLLLKNNYLIFLSLLYVTYLIKLIVSNFIRGLGKSTLFAVSNVFGSISLFLLILFFIVNHNMHIEGYILSIIISNIIVVIMILFKVNLFRYYTLNRDKILTKEMLIYSLPMIPNTLSWWINNALSKYLILWMIGISASGLFSASAKIPALINIFSTVFLQAWTYSVSDNRDQVGEMTYLPNVFKYYVSFIFIMVSFGIFLAPYISIFVLKGDFYPGWRYIPILMLASALSAISVYFGGIYQAHFHTKKMMLSTIIGSIVNIIFAVILIYFFGLFGAAIAVFIGYLTVLVIRFFDIKRILAINLPIIKHVLVFTLLLIQVFSTIYGYGILSISISVLIILVYVSEVLFVIKIIKTKIISFLRGGVS